MAIAPKFFLFEVERMISRAELRAAQQRASVLRLSQHPSEQRRARRDLDATLATIDRLREIRSDLRTERGPIDFRVAVMPNR